MQEVLLEVDSLTVSLSQEPQRKLLDQVSFVVPEQSIVALVGGSGSGKTTTGLSILSLLPSALKYTSGHVWYQHDDLMNIEKDKMRALRGKEIAMVFQDPMQSFNPVFTVGYQVSEVLRIHTKLSMTAIQSKVLELFIQVGLENPMRVYRSYPHQLSGGMRQRAMIAQAIAGNPALLIADEPTSSLDVTLQAKILELFKQLKSIYNLSIILITHDLGMVMHTADYVVVMTDGRVVETGSVDDVITNPKHRYTQQLIGAMAV